MNFVVETDEFFIFKNFFSFLFTVFACLIFSKTPSVPAGGYQLFFMLLNPPGLALGARNVIDFRTPDWSSMNYKLALSCWKLMEE